VGDSEAKGNEQSSAEPETTGSQTVDSDAEIRSTSPLKEAVKEIDNIIMCLYRLSITIQSPASRDPGKDGENRHVVFPALRYRTCQQ
jgi:hypothetical protein